MPILDNAQHELFAQEIAKGTAQRDAYKAAGYNTKSDAGADASASRLLSNAKIKARVAELQERIGAVAVEKAAVSKSWVIAKLVENVERSMQAEAVKDSEGTPTGEYKYNGNVANRALELLGKEMGMFIDRKEVGKPGDFAAQTDTELDAAILAGAQEFPELFQELTKRSARTKH